MGGFVSSLEYEIDDDSAPAENAKTSDETLRLKTWLRVVNDALWPTAAFQHAERSGRIKSSATPSTCGRARLIAHRQGRTATQDQLLRRIRKGDARLLEAAVDAEIDPLLDVHVEGVVWAQYVVDDLKD